MSVVVAVEKVARIALGSDSMTSVGSTRCVSAVGPPKVLRVGPYYIGSAGLAVYRNVLADYLASGKPPLLRDETEVFRFFVRFWRDLGKRYHFVENQSYRDSPSPFANLDAEFLVAGPHGIFRVKEILSVLRFDKFCAIGSGSPHAEGALHVLYDIGGAPTEIARRAVEAALAFDAASCGPVQVVELRRRRRK
jgi:ATP-dependent protease HslVU (ClpYQ) peptidase subunit